MGMVSKAGGTGWSVHRAGETSRGELRGTKLGASEVGSLGQSPAGRCAQRAPAHQPWWALGMGQRDVMGRGMGQGSQLQEPKE